jgi:hypothetical protein
MLGSFQDAEDLVRETLLHAWRGLYRIATYACLDAFADRARARRVLPEAQGSPSQRRPLGGPATESAWLEPYADAALDGLADTAPGPEARFEMSGAVQFAFVALRRADAVPSMPPWRECYRGREAIRAFFDWAWVSAGEGPLWLVPTATYRQPAFAVYRRGLDRPESRIHAVQLRTFDDDAIAVLTVFVDRRLLASFGVTAVLPTRGTAPSRSGDALGAR